MTFSFVGSITTPQNNRRAQRNQAKQRHAAARLVFEPLEPRVLMSADPLSVTLSGSAFHPIAHNVIIESVTPPPTQQNPTTVQMVQVIDEANNNQVLASAPLTNVSGIEITGGTGNTSLTVDAVSFGKATVPQISFSGGNGNNSLIVDAAGETDWNISGPNTGTVDGSVPIVFSGVGNLVGGGQNANVFTVSPGGTLSGTLDGGPGVNGTLDFSNYNATNAIYTASGPHAGTVSLDGTTFTYADLSPINYSGTAANVTINGSGELTLGDSGTPGQITAASLDNSMESVTFAAPTHSLTVNLTSGADSLAIATLHLDGASLTANGTGADSVTVDSGAYVSTRATSSDALDATSSGNSGNLTLNADSIVVGPGASLYANANNGFAAGTIQLNAGNNADLTTANVTVDDAQVIGGTVTIDATSSATQATDGPTAATLDLTAIAKAEVEGDSTVTATTGNVAIDATVDASGSALATAQDGAALNSDAAVAVANVDTNATAEVIGATTINASGDLTVQSTNDTGVVGDADGQSGDNGGAIAVSNVQTGSHALLAAASGDRDLPGGQDAPQVTATDVSVLANADIGIDTDAFATPGGATANSAEGQDALVGQAATPGGAVTVGSALAYTNFADTTEATSAATVTASNALNITASESRSVSTIGDAAYVQGNRGVGTGSALNGIAANTTALDTGNATIGGGATVSVAQVYGPDNFDAVALSAPGGTNDPAAVATNNVADTALAEVSGGQITAARLGVTATQADAIKASAGADDTGSVVTTNNVANAVTATIQGADIGLGTGTLTIDATSANTMQSLAGPASKLGSGGMLGTDAFNTVDTQSGDGANATAENSTIAAGTMALGAQNNDQIEAVAGGDAGQPSIAPTASLADNTADPQADADAGGDTVTLTGALTITAAYDGDVDVTAGAAATAGGGAVAANQVVNGIDATLDGGSVTAGAVTMTATNDDGLDASAAVGTSQGTSPDSASIAVNTVGGLVDGAITGGATVSSSGAVSVNGTDDGAITANAGAAASTGTVGGSTATALNRVGAVSDESSLDVTGTIDGILGSQPNDPTAEPPAAATSASIDSGASVTAGTVAVTAAFTDSVQAAAIAGLSGGATTQPASLTANLLGDQVTATIADATTRVQAVGSVMLAATNTPQTQSLAGTQAAQANTAGGAAGAVNKLRGAANATVTAATVYGLNGNVALNAVGGSAVTAAAVAGTVIVPVTIAGATTLNDVANTIDAEAEDGASITAGGNVTLTADDSGPIMSNANGNDVPGGVTPNAADATNDVADQVSARADTASLTTYGGNVELAATDTVAVHAISSALAGGTTSTATVSTNQIGNVLKAVINDSTVTAATSVFVQATDSGEIEASASQQVGGYVGSGGAGAYNQATNTVAAAIEDGANVTAGSGDVMVQADDNATLSTTAGGGATALFGASGGSTSLSIVANRVYADVSDSSVSAGGNLGVIADDTDGISAYGGQTSGAAFGAASSAVALTLNSVTEAYVDGSGVTAMGATAPLLVPDIDPATGDATATSDGGVVVAARDMETVDMKSLTVAGGLSAVPATVANIATGATTKAYITGSAVGSAGAPSSGVTVHAEQATTVVGNIGTTAGGLDAVGAEVQISSIDNTTQAYIVDDPGHGELRPVASSVYANAITVSTTTYENVSVNTNGVAGGLTALSGTVTDTDIASTSAAYVEDSLLDARGGAANITVSARDSASITTNDSNSAFGVSGIGAAVDVSTIADTTTATLIGANLNANSAIAVIANSTGTINDSAAGGTGGLAAIAGSIAIDHINSATEASTESDGAQATEIDQDPSFTGTVTAHGNTQSVTIEATGDTSVDGSAGVSAVGLVGLGAGIHIGGIDDQVTANIGTGTLIDAAGDITVTASDTRAISSTSFAKTGGAVALGGAFSILSIGGSFDPASLAAVNKANSDNSANLDSTTNQMVDEAPVTDMVNTHDSPVAASWLANDAPPAPQVADPLADSSTVSGVFATVGGTTAGAAPQLTAGGDITVSATNEYTVNASAGASTGGLVSLGIGVTYADVTDTVSAETGDGAVLAAGGGITVAANDATSKQTQVSATTGEGGLVAVGGALAHTTLHLNVDATMTPSTSVTSAAAVSVTAAQEADLQTTGKNGSGGLIAAGDVDANTTIDGSVSAAVGNGVQLGASDAIGSLNIGATTDDTAGAKATASSGGGIAGDASDANSSVTPHLSAILGNGAVVNATGNVSITTDSSGSAISQADGTLVALGAVGASSATATFAPSGSAVIGEQAFIGTNGNIIVSATDATTGSITATADSSSGAFVAGVGASATATDNGSALAEADDGATLDAGGTVSIWSAISENAESNTNTIALGFVTLGSQNGTSSADGTSTAELGSDTTVIADALQVEAAGSANATTTSDASAGGIASGLGAGADDDASPIVTAEILDGAQVTAAQNVTVLAYGSGSTDAVTNGTAGAAFAEIGSSDSTATGTPSVDAAIGRNSVVDAGGNVMVEAVSPGSAGVANGRIDAATDVNLAQNEITFSAPIYLQTGDQVTYQADGNTPVGGLQSGRTYGVITDSATGISFGQQFPAAQVNAATSMITFNAPDGFQTGDRVVYNDNGGPAIGGLVNGATYYVRVINSTTIKLATSLAQAESAGIAFTVAQIGSGGVITMAGNGFTNGEAVTYRSTGGNIGGLVNGDTYFVIRLNANQFQLAALPGGSALALSQAAVTGVQTLGSEGVALDGTGVSGMQSLVFKLTSAGSGTQHVVGVGGAAAALPTASSPPSYVADSNGSGEAALLGEDGMSSTITITGTVTAYVGTSATVKAGDDVTVEASGYRDSSDQAAGEVGGLAAVGGAYGTTTDTEITTAQIADDASLISGQDTDVTATADLGALGESTSTGGGAGAVGQANSTITLAPTTTVQIDQGAGFSAQRDLNVNATESVSGWIEDGAGDGGIGASSHADGTLTVGGLLTLPVGVQVGDDVLMDAGDTATIAADYAMPDLFINNVASSSGVYAHPTTNAFIETYAPVNVTLGQGDQIDATNQVNLSATYGAVGFYANATTHKGGIGGQDPDTLVDADMVASIIVPYGAGITTHGLDVTATSGTPIVQANAVEGSDPQYSNDFVSVAPQREISFDGNVVLTSGPAPELVVNRFGNVVDAVGVSASTAGGVITLNPIANADPGWVRFDTNSQVLQQIPATSLNFFVDSVITGTGAKFTFVDTFPTVSLWSYSAMSMVVNNIDPVETVPAAAIDIAVDSTSGFAFTVANSFQPTTITIGDYASNTAANLTIAGEIQDPIGAIALTAASGNIAARNGNAVIQGASVTLNAGGAIGSATQSLSVQVVDSPQPAMALNATAGGDLDLSVQALLRNPSVSVFTPQLGSLVAGGSINLELQSAMRDTVVLGPSYGVAVTHATPDEPLPPGTTTIATGWPNNAGPPPPLPSGIFAVGFAPISATYQFALLQAGGSITVTGPGSAGVGLTANTDATGAINVALGGNIALTETTGNMLLGAIDSVDGTVSLTTTKGAILDQSTATAGAEVVGQTIMLDANGGGIATAADPLRVHTVAASGLHVTATAAAYVDQVPSTPLSPLETLLQEAGFAWLFADGGAATGLVNWGL